MGRIHPQLNLFKYPANICNVSLDSEVVKIGIYVYGYILIMYQSKIEVPRGVRNSKGQ